MTIDRIRQLLVRYYEGQTTPAETKVLKEFFRAAKDIPEDLTADAAVFRAMSACDETDCVVPEDLKARIVAATVGSRKRFFNWKAAAGIAASLAVLVSVATALISGGSDLRHPAEDMTIDETTAYTHEVVDSAEVVEITAQMLDMLGRSFDKADHGVRYADAAIAVIRDPLNTRFDDYYTRNN